MTFLDFSGLNIKHPVELKGEVEGTGNDDDTEVVDDEVALGDGQHHPVLFLQVAQHPEEERGIRDTQSLLEVILDGVYPVDNRPSTD